MALRDAVARSSAELRWAPAPRPPPVRHGAARMPLDEVTGALPASGPVGLLGPDGTLLALSPSRATACCATCVVFS